MQSHAIHNRYCLRTNHSCTILLTSCRVGEKGLVVRLAVLRRGKFGNKAGLLNLFIFPFIHHGKASLYLQRQTTDKCGHKFMAPARLINYPRKNHEFYRCLGCPCVGDWPIARPQLTQENINIHPQVKPTSLVEV